MYLQCTFSPSPAERGGLCARPGGDNKPFPRPEIAQRGSATAPGGAGGPCSVRAAPPRVPSQPPGPHCPSSAESPKPRRPHTGPSPKTPNPAGRRASAQGAQGSSKQSLYLLHSPFQRKKVLNKINQFTVTARNLLFGENPDLV